MSASGWGGWGGGVSGALPGVEIPREWRCSAVRARAGFRRGDGGSWRGVCLLAGEVRPIAVRVGSGGVCGLKLRRVTHKVYRMHFTPPTPKYLEMLLK